MEIEDAVDQVLKEMPDEFGIKAFLVARGRRDYDEVIIMHRADRRGRITK